MKNAGKISVGRIEPIITEGKRSEEESATKPVNQPDENHSGPRKILTLPLLNINLNQFLSDRKEAHENGGEQKKKRKRKL